MASDPREVVQDELSFGESPEDSFPALPQPRRAATKMAASTETIAAGKSGTAGGAHRAALRIGDYDVVRPLGRGGTGTVYLARHRSLDRFVALKVLSQGLFAGPEQLLRFETEARIAAKLQHPNIVRVFDLGRSDAGPYIALEYVPGTTLGEHLAGAPQPARRAAEIAHTLALAVEHAHKHGIIHRDLKPANVLRAEDGAIKITDFGLARHLDLNSGATRTGEIMGTPSYMSPEQASGATALISPLSDVYSLGAILYELLTGGPPFRGAEPMAIVLSVLSHDPPTLRRIVSSVPRDLETICLKCLHKQPQRRYASAQELADDLQRYLDDRPILARPASVRERSWKWARRRPAMAVLFASLVIGITSFLSFAVWKNGQLQQALAGTQSALQRSERNFRNSLDAARRRIEQAGQPPEQMLTEELAFFEEIRRQPDEGAASRYERALASRLSGDVCRKLGRPADALQAYTEAETLLTALAKTDSSPPYRRDLAGVFNQRSMIYQDQGDWVRADECLKKGLALFEQLAKDSGDDPDFVRHQAVLLNNLGVLANRRNDPEAAADCHRRALSLREKLLAIDPRHAEYQSDLIVSQGNVATVLISQSDLPGAEDLLQKATAGYHRLPATLRHSDSIRMSWAGTLMNLGNVQLQLDKTDAARMNEELGVQMLIDLIRDYPAVPSCQQACADAEINLGKLWLTQDKLPEAIAQFESALTRYEALAVAHPDNPVYRQQAELLRPGLAELREALAREPV